MVRVGLDVLAEKARPVALAGERLLAVLAPLAPLLPDGALRRGSVLSVTGSTSLALALLAGASAAGSWCAAVGLPSLGVVAAAELGIALERFPLVAAPSKPDEWAWALAALLDAVDVVLARPPGAVGEAMARRLAAKVRERSAVLVVAGSWPGADVRLAVTGAAWEGLGRGHGRLRARRVDVVANGRGAAAREKRVALWLPGPDGGVAAVPETAVPETAVPETAVPETAMPETAMPETAMPETAMPETAMPETAMPETAMPETAMPETAMPLPMAMTAVPETAVPETAVSLPIAEVV